MSTENKFANYRDVPVYTGYNLEDWYYSEADSSGKLWQCVVSHRSRCHGVMMFCYTMVAKCILVVQGDQDETQQK